MKIPSINEAIRRASRMAQLATTDLQIESAPQLGRIWQTLVAGSGTIVTCHVFRGLSDAQWSLIAQLLPCPTGKLGRKFSEARTMVEGIVYRYRASIAWRDLPTVYCPWQTVWTWHRRLADDGTWDRIHAKLTAAADAAGLINWSLSVDSTIVRVHQHATNTTLLTGGWTELKESGH